MRLKNTLHTWGFLSQLFHWGMFAVLIGQYSIAYTMQDVAPSPTKWWLYGMHKQIGIAMLIIVSARLWWREVNPIPTDLPTVPSWQNKLARLNIFILYTLLFIFPLSGFLMSILGGHDVNYFGLFTIPALIKEKTAISSVLYQAHIYCSYLLIGFVSLHITAGFYHHFVLKDSILRRMLPGYSSSEGV